MIKEEFGSEHYQLICDKCGKVLADIYYAGSQYQPVIRGSCEHYRWISIGNACYENPEISEICRGTKELAEKDKRCACIHRE